MWETISRREIGCMRIHNAKVFSKLGNSNLPLQVKKLRQKGNIFSKKFSVNFCDFESSVCAPIPHLQDENCDLLCLKRHLTEKMHPMSPLRVGHKAERCSPSRLS